MQELGGIRDDRIKYLSASDCNKPHKGWSLSYTVSTPNKGFFLKTAQIREFLPYFCQFSPFLTSLSSDMESNKRIFPYLEFLYSH